MAERQHTVVIGAGHAGLAMSHCLAEREVPHVVLERDRVAQRWRRQRWDSFTLLTPNWATWLPGWRYDGPEPDGFMTRAQVAEYLERYADSFAPPLRCGIAVRSLEPLGARFRLDTSAGPIEAGNVVLATGPFQAPLLPAAARELPDDVLQLHSSGYRNPEQLADGATLVVGGGASGQQIAEDLLRAGRRVFVSVGRLQPVPRRYRGRDFIAWQEAIGHFDSTTDDHDGPPPRMPSPSLTGFDGGHDLDVRSLTAVGATVVGRLIGCEQRRLLRFAPDLDASLRAGDESRERFLERVDALDRRDRRDRRAPRRARASARSAGGGRPGRRARPARAVDPLGRLGYGLQLRPRLGPRADPRQPRRARAPARRDARPRRLLPGPALALARALSVHTRRAGGRRAHRRADRRTLAAIVIAPAAAAAGLVSGRRRC